MSSNYKILVDNESDEKDQRQSVSNNVVVKTEGFTIDSEPKKLKWFNPSIRSKLKKFRKAILLLTCIAFIVFFILLNLFVLHHQSKSCVVKPLRSSWNLTVSGFDLSTKLVLASSHGSTKNVAFGYHSTHKTNDTGVMMINGSSGSIIWKQLLYATPMEINCDILDVNKDGFRDCMVVGKNGLLTILNVVTGKPFWYIHSHHFNTIEMENSMPVLTNVDFNKDYISELLSMIKMPDGKITLAFISGMSGRIMGDILPIPTRCSYVSSPLKVIKEGNKANLVISCVTNSVGEVWIADIQKMYNIIRYRNTRANIPLFQKIFRCEKATSEVSLFDRPGGILIAVCNNGQVASIKVSKKRIMWKSLIPYITHSRVQGAEPANMEKQLITIWDPDRNKRSVIVAFNVDNGKIEWEYPQDDTSVSAVMPYHVTGNKDFFEALIKTDNCHRTSLLSKNETKKFCHCTEKYFSLNPKTKSKEKIETFNRFFRASGTCIKSKRSLSSVVVGDILNDGSKQAVIVKHFYTNYNDKIDDLNFTVVFSMLKLKYSEC